MSANDASVPYSLSDYERPSVAADVAIFRLSDEGIVILLIERKHPPFAKRWALPGGFVGIEESLEAAALRELEEETGVSGVKVEQLHTFGDPGRDPRGRVITVTYFALVPPDKVTVQAGDDAANAGWFRLDALPPLAFDHDQMIAMSVQRLRQLVKHHNAAFRLLPSEFTLSDVQRVHETVLGETLDKRNFRRRLLQSGTLIATGSSRGGEGRPARTYRWIGY